MTKHSHRRGHHTLNRSDANSRWKSFTQYNSGLIRKQLHQHEISPEEAVELLERSDSSGCSTAGEMCIELAYGAPDVLAAVTLLARAKDNLERAAAFKAKDGTLNRSQARALLHLAQLPNHAYIIGTGKLPPTKISTPVYEATIEAGLAISASYKRVNEQHLREASIDLAGIGTETSLLLLGQRYATEGGIDPESWFPVLSNYSEDHRNGRIGTVHDRSWDMTINQQFDDDPIKPAYLVQIKSSRSGRTRYAEPLPESGVTTVYLRPDLQVTPGEKLHVDDIILECALERESARPAYDRLQARTDLFLDALDKPVQALSMAQD